MISNNNSIERITEEFLARLPAIRTEEDGWSFLRDMTAAFARSSADHLFWKVKVEAGWSPAEINRLNEKSVEMHTVAIAETLHQFGGTLDQVHALNEVWHKAYHRRLQDLAVGEKVGGRA